jgi:hypothetical protein
MGRLPAVWADRPILDRYPYEFPGEIQLVSSQPAIQFPQAVYQNGIDKPFEVHRMIPRVMAYDSEDMLLLVQPDQEYLQALIKIEILDVGLDTMLTKAPTRLNALTKGSSERTWEWTDPHYLVRSNGFTVTAQAEAFDTGEIDHLVLTIVFEGFMCIVAPPSNNR